MSSFKDQVVAVIHEVCEPVLPDLNNEDSSLLEAGLDSLDLTTVQMAIEDKFDVSLPAESLGDLITVKAITEFLEENVNS